jgi:transcriptional regulator with XRE-family HTH domain
MNARRDRYCQCGAALARDHTGSQCGRCQSDMIERRAQPQVMPADFWNTPAFRDAFAAQHMGRVARAYRRHPFQVAVYGPSGISQELLGQWLGLTQAQISRIENGPPIRNIDTLVYWARVLGMPAGLLWFRLPGQETAIQAGPRAYPAIRPPQISADADPAGKADMDAVLVFRSADLLTGGGHVYASVITYLRDELAPRLFGSQDCPDDSAVFAAAASITELAGWMAHDAGRDLVADRHLRRALALAEIGGDRQLHAHVLGSMSHLASHLARYDDAVGLARHGQEVLRAGPASGPVLARLLALEARGHAGLADDTTQWTGLLHQAEHLLGGSGNASESPWVSGFDVASLASEAGRCLRQHGDLPGARRQAEQIIMIRPAHRVRSRALGHLALARVLTAQGNHDEACGIGCDVLAATQSLASYPVLRQLRELRRDLEPHRSSAAVGGFIARFDDTIHEQSRLYSEEE